MNPKLIKPLYYKIQLQLQMKQIQIILEITLEALKKQIEVHISQKNQSTE